MSTTREHRVARERTEPGVSLARGPALIVGTVLLAVGLYFLYRQHIFPRFSNFPSGRAPVTGHAIVGIFGINGWTGMLTAVAGGLLLFGAAQHLLAKTMSLIVGVGLGAAAIIAAVSGDVLGLMAANAWTEIGWGVAAVILLFNVAVPRRRRVVREETVAAAPGRRPVAEPVANGPSAAGRRDPVAPAAGTKEPATAGAVRGTAAPSRADEPATAATRVREPVEEYPLDRPLEPPELDPVDASNRSSSDPPA